MAEYIGRVDAIKAVNEQNAFTMTRAALIDVLNAIPAADVAPVVHGRWIHYPDCGVTKCSHCGWSIEECWESKRFPECGTKMDGAT